MNRGQQPSFPGTKASVSTSNHRWRKETRLLKNHLHSWEDICSKDLIWTFYQNRKRAVSNSRGFPCCSFKGEKEKTLVACGKAHQRMKWGGSGHIPIINHLLSSSSGYTTKNSPLLKHLISRRAFRVSVEMTYPFSGRCVKRKLNWSVPRPPISP